MRRADLAIGIGIALLSMPVMAKPVSLKEVADSKQEMWFECVNPIIANLSAKRVTPERYAMAINGACLSEDAAFVEAAQMFMFETLAPSSRQPFEQQMRSYAERAKAIVSRARQRLISEYVIWYETASKSALPSKQGPVNNADSTGEVKTEFP